MMERCSAGRGLRVGCTKQHQEEEPAEQQCSCSLATGKDSPISSQHSLSPATPLPAASPAHQKGCLQQETVTHEPLLPLTLDQQLALVVRGADAALHLVCRALDLASHARSTGTIHEHHRTNTKTTDEALRLAEDALKATLGQVARANALVEHRLNREQQQQLGGSGAAQALPGWQGVPQPPGRGDDDADDLQDTCSSIHFTSSALVQ